MPRLARHLAFVLLLLGGAAVARAGIAQYSDRGKTDFDTALQLLNPYGTWKQIAGLWAYTPTDHQPPYTHGRWLYTEYGWYWQGSLPHSWVTEHYGYWQRGADRVWSWFPGPFWLPQIVEMRATSTHIGWRSAAVDDDGNFIEASADRFAKTDEWFFVSNAAFARPITPGDFVAPDVAARLLDDSVGSTHTYMTYRAIARPGPHPADFVALSQDDGMFAPKVDAPETVSPTKPPSPGTVTASPVKVTAPPSPEKTVPTHAAPSGLANARPVPAAATPPPSLPTVATTDEDASDVDERQVSYWVTMSLPTYWTPAPRDAKPNEIYVYRPDFYQDQDGIERRIRLWFNPGSRLTDGERLHDLLGAGETPPKGSAAVALPVAGTGIPATPVPSGNPFRSPFEEPFHQTGAGPAAPQASSKAASSSLGTNAAPGP